MRINTTKTDELVTDITALCRFLGCHKDTEFSKQWACTESLHKAGHEADSCGWWSAPGHEETTECAEDACAMFSVPLLCYPVTNWQLVSVNLAVDLATIDENVMLLEGPEGDTAIWCRVSDCPIENDPILASLEIEPMNPYQ